MGAGRQIVWAWKLVHDEAKAGAAVADVVRESLRHGVALTLSGLFYGVVEPLWDRGILRPYRLFTFGRTFLQPRHSAEAYKALRKGDVVAGRCEAAATTHYIEFLSGSHWTHVGLYDGNGSILEAIDEEGVVATPIATFLERYTEAAAFRMLEYWQPERALAFAARQIGKPYNFIFAYSDGAFYCSQLVYRSFEEAGIFVASPSECFMDHFIYPPGDLIALNSYHMAQVWSARQGVFETSRQAVTGLLEMATRFAGRNLIRWAARLQRARQEPAA